MNRTIKFRGKPYIVSDIDDIDVIDINDKGWVIGSLIGDDVIVGEIVEFNDEYYHTEFWYRMQPETIGQYTGMKDKNGTEIYEGDILQLTIPDGSTRHFVVEWAEEQRKLMPLSGFEHDGNPVCISGWCFCWHGHRLYPSVIHGVPDNERMVIVGNIHDNPDILDSTQPNHH